VSPYAKPAARQSVMHASWSPKTVLPANKAAATLLQKKDLHAKQAAHLENLKRTNLLGSFFSVGMGLLFIYFSSQGFGLVYDFVFLLGIGFTVYGVVAQFVNMLIFFKKEKT